MYVHRKHDILGISMAAAVVAVNATEETSIHYVKVLHFQTQMRTKTIHLQTQIMIITIFF